MCRYVSHYQIDRKASEINEDMKSLRAKLLLPSILWSLAGVAEMYPLRILLYYPFAHIIYCNQSSVLDTVFIQLLAIGSRTFVLPYTAYDLPNQYSKCNLSIIYKGGEKRNKKKRKGRKKLYKKNGSQTSKNLDLEKN